MRVTSDAGTEAWVLTTGEGNRLLDEVARVVAPRPADLERWRRVAPAGRVAAALRLVEGRRRGAAKFVRADRMWFEPQGVEQATAEAVARHKARRFVGGLVVDLCAGIGGDSLALADGSRVLAVDVDEGMCCRCRWNAGVYDVSARFESVRARAERFGIPPGALVHIDPDRRAELGPRARFVSDYAPGLEFLRSLPEVSPGGAIKLGPASDFAAHFDMPGYEVEVVSLAGECKEATVWYGSLAGCRRRATRLPEGVTWTDRDGPTSANVAVVPPSAYLFDPDPALIRSGLLDAFASAHGLARCAAGIDYLTASAPVASPFLAAFEVLDILPIDVKVLRRVLAEHRLGPLEIKVRGLDLRPEALRVRLRPPGPCPATLLLMGGSGPARAVLAKRVEGGGWRVEGNEGSN
jgi:hypothetical protein